MKVGSIVEYAGTVWEVKKVEHGTYGTDLTICRYTEVAPNWWSETGTVVSPAQVTPSNETPAWDYGLRYFH
jgi:hypothetical protein